MPDFGIVCTAASGKQRKRDRGTRYSLDKGGEGYEYKWSSERKWNIS